MHEAHEFFSSGAFSRAKVVLEKALGIDFEHPEVLASLKCAQFWEDRHSRLEGYTDPFDKGEFLLKEWKVFSTFLSAAGCPGQEGLFPIRQWVFSTALEQYLRLLESPDSEDTELLFKVGRCYKGSGDYLQAQRFLETAGQKRKKEPAILAELADCYALLNEVRISKVFFREAFFIDPQLVELAFLESVMMTRLMDRLRTDGLKDPELTEWIPVYATLYGVFNVKRELKPLEYGKLKQAIFNLEADLDGGRYEDGNFLVPRLINRYFWLIDHYVMSGESREMIQEVLEKIKKLDASVYEHYIH
ncbi:MAG: tetratricopeptide repeat protein [Spirochaetales bacterium]|nr:tetratricopeptide repeat protein [Spirochaetales bacterium]